MHAQQQRAIAPVIGVALLLTITSLLAASVLALSMGVAGGLSVETSWDSPDAEFEIDDHGAFVIFEHTGGEPVDASALRLEGVDAETWDGDGEVREGDQLIVEPTTDRVAVVYDGVREDTLAEIDLSA